MKGRQLRSARVQRTTARAASASKKSAKKTARTPERPQRKLPPPRPAKSAKLARTRTAEKPAPAARPAKSASPGKLAPPPRSGKPARLVPPGKVAWVDRDAPIERKPARVVPPPKVPPAKSSARRPSSPPRPSGGRGAATSRPRVLPKPVATSSPKGVSPSGATARSADPGLLRLGDDLPLHTTGPLSRVDIARYCAVSGAFHPVHLDEPHARAAGLPSVVVPGGLALGLANACLSRWMRDDGRLLRLGARCVKMIWPADVLTARARVAELRGGGEWREVDLDVWVENQKGELVLRGQATCSVRASARLQGPAFFGLPLPPGTAPAARPAPLPPRRTRR